ncbi:MAG: sulfatase [Terriglobales bacterium]
MLITVDCLRADHCGFYGYARPTTPFLDSLASESIVVPTAVVAGAPTYYSLPAMMASRMPLALGRDVVGLAPDEDTLATTLHRAGYATAAFSAGNPYISTRFGYNRGFEAFHDFLDFDAGATPGPNVANSLQDGHLRGTPNRWLKKSAQAVGLSYFYDELYFQYCARIAAPAIGSVNDLRKYPSADMVVESAESWLASIGSRPFFLWIHLMDPHHPYYPPAAAFRDLTGRSLPPARMRYLNEFWNRSDAGVDRLQKHKEAVVELYDAGIRWVDSQIARLVSGLQHSGHWGNCVFALTADHGEEFLEHGRRYHAPVSLTEEIARVPLIFRVPGTQKVEHRAPHLGTQTARPSGAGMVFSHLHLAPTLLEILEVPPPPDFQGKSLWKRLQRGPWPGRDNDPVESAIAECVYGCTNPLNEQTRLSPRLLCVREARYKLVMRLEPGAVEEVYDVISDPKEKSPLRGGGTAEIRRRLLLVAMEYIKTTSVGDRSARLKFLLRDLRLKLHS